MLQRSESRCILEADEPQPDAAGNPDTADDQPVSLLEVTVTKAGQREQKKPVLC